MGSTGYLVIAALLFLSMAGFSEAQLSKNYITWTPNGCNFSADGKAVALTLQDPKMPYASMSSKQAYLFGGAGAWVKLVPNDSAGTVSTLYLSSTGLTHCEFDFEFLGNVSGQPYLLHTNIFVNGVGGREQQIRLWFDATADFHYYNFQWNNEVVVFYVDSVPIRMYGNYEYLNNSTKNSTLNNSSKNSTANSTLPADMETFMYPKDCPMSLYTSIWDGSGWATEGGGIKLNWTHAPFTVQYKQFTIRACPADQNKPATIKACQNSTFAKPGLRVGGSIRKKLRWVRDNYIHYNYCTDKTRYTPSPPECQYNVL